MRILPRDDAESLAARVLEAEHRLYPIALEDYCRAIAFGGQLHRRRSSAIVIPAPAECRCRVELGDPLAARAATGGS